MAQDYVLLTASASARELGFPVPPSDATKGRIPLSPRGVFLLPPLEDWKIFLPLLRLCWTAKNIGPLCRSCSVFRSDELYGKQGRTIFRVASFCSSPSPIARPRLPLRSI